MFDNSTIFILLLLGGGVPQRGEVVGKTTKYLLKIKNSSHLPPRPSGTPPPTGGGELE